MTIVRYEIIAKVVELGSFTETAETLNMTQSAVSHAVASLESEWGVSLLIRDRKKRNNTYRYRTKKFCRILEKY